MLKIISSFIFLLAIEFTYGENQIQDEYSLQKVQFVKMQNQASNYADNYFNQSNNNMKKKELVAGSVTNNKDLLSNYKTMSDNMSAVYKNKENNLKYSSDNSDFVNASSAMQKKFKEGFGSFEVKNSSILSGDNSGTKIMAAMTAGSGTVAETSDIKNTYSIARVNSSQTIDISDDGSKYSLNMTLSNNRNSTKNYSTEFQEKKYAATGTNDYVDNINIQKQNIADYNVAKEENERRNTELQNLYKNNSQSKNMGTKIKGAVKTLIHGDILGAVESLFGD